MYIVHMKRVTASEARKNWFRLLDEVAQGAVVCIERGGRRIVLRREDAAEDVAEVPDYSAFLRVPGVNEADQWRWAWSDADGSLELDGHSPPKVDMDGSPGLDTDGSSGPKI